MGSRSGQSQRAGLQGETVVSVNVCGEWGAQRGVCELDVRMEGRDGVGFTMAARTQPSAGMPL